MQRSVVIIGAGPAGMAAAIEAIARNCKVTLLDEAALPGGQIYRQAAKSLQVYDYAEAREIERKKQLLRKFESICDRIDYRPGTSVYALFPNREVHASRGGATEVFRPDTVVIAAGVRETAIPFPGWTLPGVMFAGGSQALLKSQGILPGRRAVVAGCGPLPLVVAAQIIRAHGEVKALATLNSMVRMLAFPVSLWNGREIVAEGFRYLRSVRRAGVPRLAHYVPVRALGNDKLEAVVLERVGRDGRTIPGSARQIECDLLALNYGFSANAELAAIAGAQLRYDGAGGGWVPVTDEFGRTSVGGILVAGDCAGLRGALVAETEGHIVGAAAASDECGEKELRASLRSRLALRRKHLSFQKAVRATLKLPPALWGVVSDDTIVCRCENVSFGEIRSAFDSGHVTPNAVKRNVRPGMGWCAGRTCLRAIGSLSEMHTGTDQAELMTARPMVRPVSFSALVNQTRAAS